jgi:hypothetical protein
MNDDPEILSGDMLDIQIPAGDLPELPNVEPLSVDDAWRLIDQVKQGISLIVPAVIELWQRCGWQAAGYDSWNAMCAAEFRVTVQLPKSERVKAVQQMTDVGMSTRAIASALDVGNKTVARDQHDTVSFDTVREVTGLDGRTFEVPSPSSLDELLSRVPVLDDEGSVLDGDVLDPEVEDEAEATRGARMSLLKSSSTRFLSEVRAAVEHLKIKSEDLAELDWVAREQPELADFWEVIENGRNLVGRSLQDLAAVTATFEKAIKKSEKAIKKDQ